MDAARRLCVRALVLAEMIGAIASLALPACQFPEYGTATGGGSGGTATGGVAGDSGGAAGGGEEGGANESGGSDDGGSGGGGTPPVPCPVEACVAKPAGWQGPFAFWDESANASTAPPECPDGYAKPIDLHHGIDLPTGGCQCTCKAQDQVCSTNTVLHIYDDQKCEGTPCTSLSSPLSCGGVSDCIHALGTLKAAIPTPSGGFCNDVVTPPAPASWQYDSRLCSINGASVCEDRSLVCAPLPGSPYLSKLCVTMVVGENEPLPACPDQYRNGSKTLYKSFSDLRQCSECGCSGVTGGSCAGKLFVSADEDCSSAQEYKLGTGCQPFTLMGNNAHPTSVGAEYTVTPGTCKVVTPSTTVGVAPTTGPATLVCCQ